MKSADSRIVLLTIKVSKSHLEFQFGADDCLLIRRESVGMSDHLYDAYDARVCVPMAPGLRSLNVAVCAAIVVREALRQTNRFS